ncbi:Acid phosphatase type 7 [Bulinus truncatus]|nr:Acid phosphatase type 7 [Bulinus truncatus]
MSSKSFPILLCLFLIILERSCGVENFVKPVDQSATQPDENRRDREDESLWCSPEHVHLSYGKSAYDVTVIWATRGNCKMIVEFENRPWKLDRQAESKMIELESAENNSLKYIHRSELQALSPATTYYCRIVTTNKVGKEVFYFRTLGATNETLNFLLASNLDDKVTVGSIQKEALSGSYATFLYNGDLETKLNLTFGETGNNLMVQMDPFATYLPILTAPGMKVDGREDGWYLYRNMFSMPGTDWPIPSDKLWYSLDIGLVHFISYSTDVLFETDNKKANLQKEWLVNDLRETNKRRDKTPWVIALGNHPMYCAFGLKDVQDCVLNTSKVKQSFEDVFYHLAVDLVIESRHTYYERTWPQYKGVLVGNSYHQPGAPVEVILGSPDGHYDAGDENANSTFTPAYWSAFHLREPAANSFASLSVINASHLEWKLLSSEGQTVLDSFWLVQNTHANFSLANLPHNVSHQINQTIIALGGKPGTYDFISGTTGDPAEGEGWSKYSLWMGLAALAGVVVLVLGLVAVRSCMRKRRAKAGRRWRDVDGQSGEGAFYSVASDSDSEDNDFEIDVYDKTNKQNSKLLTSY